MADEEKKENQNQDEGGLGNLPPLSDFDSQADSDGGLPPLGGFDSDDAGGLPPISDIQVEEPTPAGGNIKPAPPGFESAGSFSSGSDPTEDTPADEGSTSGFQGLDADSDFSPETPEIGPGPDSDVNTPMFDSAFGGGEDFDQAVDTPAPTQAMETPMFGGEETPAGGGGFDAGGFGGDFSAGATPPPDFSPDTGMQDFGVGAATPAAAAGPPPKRGGVGVLALLIVLILGAVAGLAGGPWVASKLSFMDGINPVKQELNQAEQTIGQRDTTIRNLNTELEGANEQLSKYIDLADPEILKLTPQQRKELGEQIADLRLELQGVTAELEDVTTELNQKNEEFVQVQEEYESLVGEHAILQARYEGLQAEAARLTRNVGDLESAEARRVATKKALAHAVDRLSVQIKEGMPLTPKKYDHGARVDAVAALQRQVANAQWVTPALQDAYTDLYLKELEIANATEYFFAKVRVTDRIGNKVTKWAECVMNGNWSVSYTTLDGKQTGVYQNLAPAAGAPIWGFQEDLPEKAQRDIAITIAAARPDGWEEQVAYLEAREAAAQESTEFQRQYNAL